MSLPIYVASCTRRELLTKQAVVITTVLRNAGKKPILILRRNTPFEAMFSDVFQVTHEDNAKPRVGAMAKRAVPSRKEFALLKPNATLTHRLTLDQGYDMKASSDYVVRWSGHLMHASIGSKRPLSDAFAAHRIDCEPVKFKGIT